MSEEHVLTLIENTAIQDYIFSSNNLTVNIGASELVDHTTGDWLFEALEQPNNLAWKDGRLDFTPEVFETHQLQAEVIYRGGGNALILFRGRPQAEEFTRRLTARILCEAPGLQVVVSHQPFDLAAQVFRIELTNLRKTAALRKLDRRFSVPLSGLSVTAACVFTGQPAAAYTRLNQADTSKTYISAEIEAKLAAAEEARERLNKQVNRIRQAGCEQIDNFELFGTRGESSYIAVVHADGNQMGKRFENSLKPFTRPEQNRAAINALRAFSASIARASVAALDQTVQLLIDSLDQKENAWIRPDASDAQQFLKVDRQTLRRDGQDVQLLPFRPLVIGGDDITFITDGRLGLALAQAYLQACTQQTLEDGQPLFCRAGVAIVKTHFPFSRAYALAEDLAASAKHAFLQDGYPNVSALDWHFATSGVIRDLETLRKNEMSTAEGHLEMRPILLETKGREWRSWQTFTHLVDTFQADENWSGRRNKIKALREALREGKSAVEQFNQYFLAGKGLPAIAGLDDLASSGWYEKRCGYFDAIEAVDFYIPLDGKRP